MNKKNDKALKEYIENSLAETEKIKQRVFILSSRVESMLDHHPGISSFVRNDSAFTTHLVEILNMSCNIKFNIEGARNEQRI
jgi:hypothetical protein